MPILLALTPATFQTYHEPFVGGGALFFALYRWGRIQRAILSDINAELMDTYQALQQEVEAVIQLLDSYPHHQDFYYSLREQDPWHLSRAERAARMIYLNKTGYNGLYRVNKKGKFNVPFGRYKRPNYKDFANLRAVARALQKVTLKTQSFEAILQQAKPGDFVYLDPPYDPVSSTASFTQYHAQGFNKEDQRRLAEVFESLARQGVYVMLSNADTPFIRSLYQSLGHIISVHAPRFINSKGDKRGPHPEVVVLSYSLKAAGMLWETAASYLLPPS